MSEAAAEALLPALNILPEAPVPGLNKVTVGVVLIVTGKVPPLWRLVAAVFGEGVCAPVKVTVPGSVP